MNLQWHPALGPPRQYGQFFWPIGDHTFGTGQATETIYCMKTRLTKEYNWPVSNDQIHTWLPGKGNKKVQKQKKYKTIQKRNELSACSRRVGSKKRRAKSKKKIARKTGGEQEKLVSFNP